jgi:DNA-binding CsgD family transcriptional regulator
MVIETARGGTRADIAARLYISVNTLHCTRQRAMRRLGATSPAHMVARAIALGLIPADVARTPDDPEPQP